MNTVSERQSYRIVLYGDSISEVGRTPNWFGGATAPERNWGARLGAMLKNTFPSHEFEMLHFGMGGQNSYEGLGRLDWLGAMTPDVVLLEFGTNDCGWHPIPPEATVLAIKTMIEAIQTCHKAEVVVIPPVGDNPLRSRLIHVQETRLAIQQTAQSCGVRCVDIASAMLAAAENGILWGKFHNGDQDCHPNDAGHEFWAKTVLDQLSLVFQLKGLNRRDGG